VEDLRKKSASARSPSKRKSSVTQLACAGISVRVDGEIDAR
jgi:hypothetical protein